MQLPWRMCYSCACFIFLWMVPAAEKLDLTLAAIIHNHNFLRRTYKTSVRTPINEVNYGRGYNLTKDYFLQYQLIYLRPYSPPEILKALCSQVLDAKANALLYLSDVAYKADRTAAAQYILEIAHFLGLPVIAWIGDNSGLVQPSPESNILHLTPSIAQQCNAMLHILMRYEWHHFSILTGAVAGQDHFVNVLRALADSSKYDFDIEAVIKIQSLKEDHVRSGLKKLEKAETRVILFYASGDEAQIILPQAKQQSLTGKEYLWIITQSALGSALISSDDEDDELLLPENIKEKNKHFLPGMLGVGYKTDDDTRADALSQGAKVWTMGLESMVNDPRAWVTNVSLIPQFQCQNLKEENQWKPGKLLLEHMKNVTIEDPPISFEEDGTNPDLELSIMNLNMEYQWVPIGRWDMKTGLKMDDITWPEKAPMPPQGRPSRYHLKVVTLQEKPYVVYSDPDPKTGTCPPQSELCRIAHENITNMYANASSNSSLYQCCSGFCIDLLKMLSDKIGFDFELFEVADKTWGAYDTDKQEWNGLIRSIMDGEADMVMTSLKITPERYQMIDFSVPFLETGITILVAVRDGVISPTAFLEPFDILCWLFILMMCIHIVAVTILIFEWLSPQGFDLKNKPPREPYDYPSWCLILVFSVHASGAAIFIFEWLSPGGLDRGNKPIREHRFSLFRSFWLIWAMLFGAAVNVDNPRGVSSRFLANIWALFAVVFTASYTANLAAFMITKEDYDKLSGIKDWRLMKPELHKPPFKFATIPHGSTETNLKKNYRRMHEWMKPYNKSTVTEGVRAVKDGEINAFIYDATVLEYLAGHDDSCKLRTVGSWYAMTGYGIGFPKGSKWINIVNKYMVQFQHEGDMERLQKFWLAGACKKSDKQGESSSSLGILNFTSAFILLAGGMLLGGLLLLLEHGYFKFLRVKLRKWDKCGCCGLISLSMGKSLTFEQSVREAIELQKHFKCKNPICETQVWKLKHELDLALLKIDRLQKQLGENGITPDKRGVWRNSRPTRQPQPAIGWKAEILPLPPSEWKDTESRAPITEQKEIVTQDPSHSPYQKVDTAMPPAPVNSIPIPPKVPTYDAAVEYPSQPVFTGFEGGHLPQGGPLPPTKPPFPGRQVVEEPNLPNIYNPPTETELPQVMQKGLVKGSNTSKSLPSSPVRNTEMAKSWQEEPFSEPSSSNIQESVTHPPSSLDTHKSPSQNRKSDKKMRHHKGNVYVEVEDDEAQVEKETVL